MPLDSEECLLDSIQVSVTEELPDGTRMVTTFNTLEEIPEHLAAAFGMTETRAANGLKLRELVQQIVEQAQIAGSDEADDPAALPG
jgi:hypothetical protein